MKEIFLALDQQRVTKDAIENLGPPSQIRGEQLMRERLAQRDAERIRQTQGGQ
jgi:hypothetical protein